MGFFASRYLKTTLKRHSEVALEHKASREFKIRQLLQDLVRFSDTIKLTFTRVCKILQDSVRFCQILEDSARFFDKYAKVCRILNSQRKYFSLLDMTILKTKAFLI